MMATEKPTVTVVPLAVGADQPKILPTDGDGWEVLCEYKAIKCKNDRRRERKHRRKFERRHYRHHRNHPYKEIPKLPPARLHGGCFPRPPFVRPPRPDTSYPSQERYPGARSYCFKKGHNLKNRAYSSDSEMHTRERTAEKQTFNNPQDSTQFEFDMSYFTVDEISVTVEGDWLRVHGKHAGSADDSGHLKRRSACEMNVRVDVTDVNTEKVQGLLNEDGKLVIKFMDVIHIDTDDNAEEPKSGSSGDEGMAD